LNAIQTHPACTLQSAGWVHTIPCSVQRTPVNSSYFC
jgi:hypothetical protein